MAAVLPALLSMLDGELEVDATVLDEDASGLLPVEGAVAMLVLLSLDDGAVAVLLLSVEEGVVVDAVVAAVSSLRPQPASTAAMAMAVAASVSFFMGRSLLLTTNWKILGAHPCGPGPHASAIPV